MSTNTFQVKLAAEAELINTNKPTQRRIEITVKAPAMQKKAERTPLNLSLVLDRSGSMDGNKLTNAKLAAEHIVNKLEETDTISIVAFDDQIATISPGLHLTEANKEVLRKGIRFLHTGGSTNLGDGWLRGCQLIGEVQSPSYLNRCLLLTDGQANQGMVDLEELGYHASQINQRGVSTSTFGIGEDYNERLLEHMANQGGGHYYFIETAHDIPLAVATELEGLTAISARNCTVTLTYPDNIDLRLLGDHKHTDSAGKMVIQVGDLVADCEIALYLIAMTLPRTVEETIEIHAEVNGLGEDQQNIQAESQLKFVYVSEDEVNKATIDHELIKRYTVVELGIEAEKALKLEKEGRRAEGSHHLRGYIRSAAPSLGQEMSDRLFQVADSIDMGLSPMDQKRMHLDMYNNRNRRHEMTEEEKEDMRKKLLGENKPTP